MKKTYTVQDKDAAVKHFQTTENSLRECARLYGIPTMTLSENARSGFEATSIWPLDRSKISNEKTGGTNYYNEATELPLSHFTSDYFASKKNQTKQTKVVKRNNLWDELQTILNDQDLIVIGRLIPIYFEVSGSVVKSVVVGFVPFV